MGILEICLVCYLREIESTSLNHIRINVAPVRIHHFMLLFVASQIFVGSSFWSTGLRDAWTEWDWWNFNQTYCWWRNSCTTWDVWNPINNGIIIILGGAGFQPSTVWTGGKAIVKKRGEEWGFDISKSWSSEIKHLQTPWLGLGSNRGWNTTQLYRDYDKPL